MIQGGALAWTLILSGSSAVSALAEPGLTGAKVASTLQSMQGHWRQTCRADVTRTGFQRVNLRVTFSHLHFDVSRYSDDQCRQALSSRASSYRFVLGDHLRLPDGESIFALDLTADDAGGPAYPLAPLNIIQYRQGQLLFGKGDSESAQNRPNHLDYDAVFSR